MLVNKEMHKIIESIRHLLDKPEGSLAAPEGKLDGSLWLDSSKNELKYYDKEQDEWIDVFANKFKIVDQLLNDLPPGDPVIGQLWLNDGLSGGNAIQMGWLDRKDVTQWMEVANRIYGDSTSMVVHGISMGAATTMMVSGEPQPDYVKCFVEDCGYTSVWDQFSKELKAQFGLPQFPLMYTADWLCQLEYGWGFKEASALKQVARCHLPMFFIHGDKDDYVPTWMMYKLYEAKPQPKALWIVPEADHAHSYLFNTEEYTQKVKAFVDKYIQ
jgi:fermentation-respiration switch protein FrsA (DUF1100 family)